MKLEYVILAVLMAAAAVTAVIYFGQSLNQQTAVAAQATAGRTTQARAVARAGEESTPSSSRRITGARDEKTDDTRAPAGSAAPARDATRKGSPDAGQQRGAESLAVQRSTTLRAGTTAQDRDAARGGPPDTAVAGGNLLWLVPVALIVGAGLVYVLSSRLRS